MQGMFALDFKQADMIFAETILEEGYVVMAKRVAKELLGSFDKIWQMDRLQQPQLDDNAAVLTPSFKVPLLVRAANYRGMRLSSPCRERLSNSTMRHDALICI